MKPILTILLAFSLLTSSISKLAVFTDYLFNQEKITAAFCENKDKPKLKCEGKCHLSKEISKQEKQEGSSKSLKEINEFPLFKDVRSFQLNNLNPVNYNPFWLYNSNQAEGYYNTLFKPPAA